MKYWWFIKTQKIFEHDFDFIVSYFDEYSQVPNKEAGAGRWLNSDFDEIYHPF